MYFQAACPKRGVMWQRGGGGGNSSSTGRIEEKKRVEE